MRIFNLLAGRMIKGHNNRGSELRRRDNDGIVVNIKQKRSEICAMGYIVKVLTGSSASPSTLPKWSLPHDANVSSV